MLENVDLGKKLDKRAYKSRMRDLQSRLHQLQHACYDARLGSLIVFEGWDAAGKGTAVRKLTERLEPRGFELHAIQAPRTHELQMPWLWRFWQRVPNWGQMAIFDRSWYGRVLVERVEEQIPVAKWRDAFRDIRGFERALSDDRYVIVKFFLHIDRGEQRRRFEALEKDPATAWQVDPEDWEHHENHDRYLVATEEMLERTETEWGPWTIVEATDRRWARAKVFETVIERLEHGLERLGHARPEYAGDEDLDRQEEDEEDRDL